MSVLMISKDVSAREPDLEKGKDIFQQSCVVCHGSMGQGDGYKFLSPPPVDLSFPANEGKSDKIFLRSICEGYPDTDMGTWNMAFSDEEMRDVLASIRLL